ncbi:MAG: ABC transporter substrate-binding protein, partial [Burkholderiales bacterium]|nr:ABC transporter substrate-binding protein [Burkholderiales bacterium]
DSFNTQAAAIASKLLRGADPGELPMERIHVFELVVNLKTARALGLAMPSDIMVRADRIIE